MSRQQRVTSVAVHGMWQKNRFMKKKSRVQRSQEYFFYCVFCGPWYTLRASHNRLDYLNSHISYRLYRTLQCTVGGHL
jgi:hypothetical protein